MSELAVFDPMMALVAQNIKNREATPEESLIIDVAIVNNENQRRSLAWLAREGKTWKNIVNPTTGENFTSFEAYGKFRMNLETAALHNLASAYNVDSILKNSTIVEKEIPINHARELNKLPDSAIPETYQAAIELAREEGKKLGAKHVEEAVNEWREKHESAQKRINWLEIDREGTMKQNDQLRNDLAFKVDVKVAEAKAQLILENQQAIADEKRKAENLANELERLKREQAKAIQDGVTIEKNKIQTELNQIMYQIEVNKRDFEELQKAKRELDAEVGAIAIHKDSIKHIKNDLTSLACHFSDAFETETIPPETVSDWTAIYDALNKLVTQMREWRENNTLIGELVD